MRTPRIANIALQAVLALALAGGVAVAQEARLQLPNLEKLAKQATESVDVTLDLSLLQLAASFLSDRDKDEAVIKELLGGLQGIYVKSYEFDREGLVAPADIEAIRAQLGRGSWSRLVETRSARASSSSEVYAWMDKGKSQGLAVVVFEPRKFTVVNIVGRIDLEKLRSLEGQLGIPKLQLDVPKPKPKPEPKPEPRPE